MNLLKSTVLVTSMAGLAIIAGCRSPSYFVSSASERVLFTVPDGFVFQLEASPSGTLFASTHDGIYRASPPHYDDWQRIANTGVVISLYAPNDSTLFGVTRTCNSVYRWTPGTGWASMPTPISDSTWYDGHTRDCISLMHVGGRNEAEVYVVGFYGTILRFDGDEWHLEEHPLLGDIAAHPYSRQILASVVATSEAVYVGGSDLIRKEPHASWEVVPRPAEIPRRCEYMASAAHADVALFAWNSCLLSVRDGAQSVVVPEIGMLSSTLYRGRSQSDGTAVFWTYFGDIVHVTDRGLQLYQLRHFGAGGGVVAAGAWLIAAGARGGSGYVIAFPRRR